MASLLQSSTSLREGKLAHHRHILLLSSFPSPSPPPPPSSPSPPAPDTYTVFLHNLLIQMYARHGSSEDAFSVFSSMPCRDRFSWILMMRASVLRHRSSSSSSGNGNGNGNGPDDRSGIKTRSVHEIPRSGTGAHGGAEEGGERALFLFEQMKCEGFLPDSNSIATFLLACSCTGDINKGRQIHSSMVISFHGYLEADLFICNGFISLYAKDGDFYLCRSVYDGCIHKDVVTWTAMASGYAQKNLHREALSLLRRMKQESLLWDRFCFATILSSCSGAAEDCCHSLRTGKHMHSMISSCLGYGDGDRDVPVWNALLRMYIRFGCKEDAERAFHSMPLRNEISYTTMINAYAIYGEIGPCLAQFRSMQNIGLRINKVVLLSTISSSCFGTDNGRDAEQLHVYVLNATMSEGGDVAMETSLITMYGRCRRADLSRRVFDRMQMEANVCTWNAMIMACSHSDEGEDRYDSMKRLVAQMMEEGIFPDKVTFVTMISTVCVNSIRDGKRMHASIVSSASLNTSLANALLSMYGKCDLLRQGLEVFNKDLDHDCDGVSRWDAVTFIHALSACTHPNDLTMGKLLHGCMVEHGHVDHDGIGLVNSLMGMYRRCGCFDEVWQVFGSALEPDTVSWSILISANVEYGHEEEALRLFVQLQSTSLLLDVSTDKAALLAAISACARLRREATGRSVHALIAISAELDKEDEACGGDMEIASALIDMYGKCGALVDALRLFEMARWKDAVLWTSIISACVQQGQGGQGSGLFIRMRHEGVIPTTGTLASLLSSPSSSSSSSSSLSSSASTIDDEDGDDDEGMAGERNRFFLGLQAMAASRFESGWTVMGATALASLLGRAGHLSLALKAFGSVLVHSTISCNALIAVLAQHGQGNRALEQLRKMQIEGLMPDSATLVGILFACSHDGLVQEASDLVKHWLLPGLPLASLDHYNCIFDLLRRAAQLDTLMRLFVAMPLQPSFVSWMTFIGGGCEHWDGLLQASLIGHAVEVDVSCRRSNT